MLDLLSTKTNRLDAVVQCGTNMSMTAVAEEPQHPSWLRHLPPPRGPFTVVLGSDSDGGVPHAGSFADPRWDDPAGRRRVVCLGIVEPASGRRWIIDATPDFPRQSLDLHRLSEPATAKQRPAPPAVGGVFLTHGHVGHSPGLICLGKEAIGATKVPTYPMPRRRELLGKNGPWSQLVSIGNISLEPLAAGEPVELAPDLRVTPVLVAHRAEFSETVAFRIATRSRSLLWLPDIDSWCAWDEVGTRLEDALATVDVTSLDGCFFAGGELPGRDMSKVPPPARDRHDRAALPPRIRRWSAGRSALSA